MKEKELLNYFIKKDAWNKKIDELIEKATKTQNKEDYRILNNECEKYTKWVREINN